MAFDVHSLLAEIKEFGIKNAVVVDVPNISFSESCRFPEKALASMEAYGIDVVKLAKDHDFPYHHGSGTVSYVGLLLYSRVGTCSCSGL